ncbi:Zinc knuckle CX2CX4HX4C [Sesbania bispinosa]|nr:Zinc knuckle CX2CX4HX4C [Sesbania bispinosa]
MTSNLIVFDEENIQEGLQDCRNSVIGKLLTEKSVHANRVVKGNPLGVQKFMACFASMGKESTALRDGPFIKYLYGYKYGDYQFIAEPNRWVNVLVLPLLPGINAGSKKDGVFWVDFQFERLPFCYQCGVIGHDEDSCTGEKNDGDDDHPRGPRMRASHSGKAVRTESSHQKPKRQPPNPIQEAKTEGFSPRITRKTFFPHRPKSTNNSNCSYFTF